jgi:cysteine desulfurase/selenocysteine lyase
MALDVRAVRRQFPILDQTIEGHPLIYLDNAATAQKPRAVLDAMTLYYERDNGNPHRGMHPLAERATQAYEGARGAVAKFLNADKDEIIFTKGATEGINLVAHGMRKTLKPGDTVVLTPLEHHSDIVPWLQIKEEIDITLEWIEMDEEGTLDLTSLDRILAKGKTKIVCVTALSNVLGVRPPLETIIGKAHAAGAAVLVDAAQSVAHGPTDVRALDCDYLVFSGHKLYGPTGIGVLFGKRERLETLAPMLGGGMMIQEVFKDRFTPADIPSRFEAGTQPVAEAVGLRAAVEWLKQFSWKDIELQERALLTEAVKTLAGVPGLTILGPEDPLKRTGSVSFTVDDLHPHDLTEILGRDGICLRAGHHCTQPLHRCLNVIASTRLSVALYNTLDEVRAVAPAIEEARQVFAHR